MYGKETTGAHKDRSSINIYYRCCSDGRYVRSGIIIYTLRPRDTKRFFFFFKFADNPNWLDVANNCNLSTFFRQICLYTRYYSSRTLLVTLSV